jgi:hypothetical protein
MNGRVAVHPGMLAIAVSDAAAGDADHFAFRQVEGAVAGKRSGFDGIEFGSAIAPSGSGGAAAVLRRNVFVFLRRFLGLLDGGAPHRVPDSRCDPILVFLNLGVVPESPGSAVLGP